MTDSLTTWNQEMLAHLKNRNVTIFALFLKYTNTAAMTTNESAKI